MVTVAHDRFADRLDASTYQGDDDVVGVYEFDAADQDSLWLSGRLFRRLTDVAVAYELHTLPLLGGSDPVRLDRVQCQSLLDELAFLAERLNDAVAWQTAQAITDYVAVRTGRPAWSGLVTFEGDRTRTLKPPDPQAAGPTRCQAQHPLRALGKGATITGDVHLVRLSILPQQATSRGWRVL